MFFLDTDEALDIAPAPLVGTGLAPKSPQTQLRVDWSLPITRGLQICTVMQNGGETPVELVGQHGTLDDSPNMNYPTYKEGSYYFAGNGNGLVGDDRVKYDYPFCDGDRTVLAAVRITEQNAGNYNYIFGSDDGGDSYLYRNKSTGQIAVKIVGTGSHGFLDLNTGQILDIGTTYQLGFVADFAQNLGWRVHDGQMHSLTKNGTGFTDTNFATRTQALLVAAPGNIAWETYYGLDGYIDYLFVWNRPLSREEIKAVYDNPRHFLRPKLDVLPLQSRNVPGGYALPAAFEQPRSMIPGVKPTWPVEVDWTHELSRGLVQAFIFDGQNMTDLVNGDRLTLHGDARIDRDLVLPSEGSGATVKNRLVNNGSVSTGWDVDAAIASYYLFDTLPPRDIVLFGTNMFLFANNTAASPVQPNNWALQAGYVTATANFGVNEYYQNGALYRNFSDLATVGGTSTMYIGTRYTLVNTMIGRFRYFYVHDRNLTADEVRRLNADPYQFLKIKGT